MSVLPPSSKAHCHKRNSNQLSVHSNQDSLLCTQGINFSDGSHLVGLISVCPEMFGFLSAHLTKTNNKKGATVRKISLLDLYYTYSLSFMFMKKQRKVTLKMNVIISQGDLYARLFFSCTYFYNALFLVQTILFFPDPCNHHSSSWEQRLIHCDSFLAGLLNCLWLAQKAPAELSLFGTSIVLAVHSLHCYLQTDGLI